MTSSQCLTCRFYIFNSTCEAFPEKIPQEIFDGTVIHDKPYAGDNGIIYKPVWETERE